MITGQRAVSDILTMMRQTSLLASVNGQLYRAGTRPRGSEKEDITVAFTTADAEQFQTGVVTVNVFVPDLAGVMGDGTWIEDSARCETLEQIAKESIEEMKAMHSNYLLSLQNAIYTQREENIHQSIVVIRIRFKYID